MAYRLNSAAMAQAFAGASLPDGDRQLDFRCERAGPLHIRSGRIAASDPLVVPDPEPFVQAVPQGEHPVELAIAVYPGNDERIAFARVSFSDTPVANWRMALQQEQDVTTLAADAFFGYGVDAGLGCFMDPQAGKALRQRMDADEGYADQLINDMERNDQPTRSWLSFRPADGDAANVVCFSSGWGDGVYPSFFGFAASGEVVALVTDFCLLVEPDAASPKPAAARPWWRFW